MRVWVLRDMLILRRKSSLRNAEMTILGGNLSHFGSTTTNGLLPKVIFLEAPDSQVYDYDSPDNADSPGGLKKCCATRSLAGRTFLVRHECLASGP